MTKEQTIAKIKKFVITSDKNFGEESYIGLNKAAKRILAFHLESMDVHADNIRQINKKKQKPGDLYLMNWHFKEITKHWQAYEVARIIREREFKKSERNTGILLTRWDIWQGTGLPERKIINNALTKVNDLSVKYTHK